MKKVFACMGALGLLGASAFAYPSSIFDNTDRFIAFAGDIVVAECVSVSEPDRVDGGVTADVDVIKVLKGDRKPGRLQVETHYPMKPKTRYMIRGGRGQAPGGAIGVDGQLCIVRCFIHPLLLSSHSY